jgi:hypothetical protein
MKQYLIALAAFSLVFPIAGIAKTAEQTAIGITPVSGREVRSLMKNAHGSEQYRQLAGYFRRRAANYRARAAAERVERGRRASINAGLAQKYPRPVDSAQHRYESYLSNANRAAALAQHYDRLASDSGQLQQQLTTPSSGKS